MKLFSKFIIVAVLLVTVLSFTFYQPVQQKHNTLSKKEVDEGWILLFDGATTNNWRPFRNRQSDGWKVMNGELVNISEGVSKRADLISAEKFDNFELVFDWKIAKGGNSGVIYRVTEDNGATYESGPEYSLIDDNGYAEKLNDVQKSGANYDVHAPNTLASNPIGEFNRSKIIVKNAHVEHWLNGKKVVEYEFWSPEWEAKKNASKWKDVKPYGMAKSGHIALQDHGGGVWFRNIKIRKLAQ